MELKCDLSAPPSVPEIALEAASVRAKARSAAKVMIKTPLDLIGQILLKHETSALEVMHELNERIGVLTDLLIQALPYVATNPDLHQHGGDELNVEIRAALAAGRDAK
jgi:hypothetical protein